MRAWMRAGKRQASGTPWRVGGWCLLALVATPVLAQGPYWYTSGHKWPLLPHSGYLAVQTVTPGDATAILGAYAAAGGPVNAAGSQVAAGKRYALIALNQPRTDQLSQVLAGLPGVERLLPVFGAGEYAQVLTDEFLVRLPGALTPALRATLEDRYAITFVRQFTPYVPNSWIARVNDPNASSALDVANTIRERENVFYCYPNFITRMSPMAQPKSRQQVPLLIPSDPLFPNQWHLNSTGALGDLPDSDVNGPEAWDISTGSPQVIIGVIDTALQETHEDFQAPGKIRPGWDVITNTNNPNPVDMTTEEHGTAVTGVATSVMNNARGGTGAAPGCRVFGVRFIVAGVTAADEVEAFDYCFQAGASIINNSWGPVAVAFGIPVPLPDATRAAMDNLADNGRGGLGTAILFAAGNSNNSTSLNGYLTYPKVITVAASDDQDVKAGYSCLGPEVDVCAPSGGGINGITTTDFMGADGYDPSNYTNSFSGTSSACPLATGVAALVLSVDPQLTRVELQDLLQDTAKKIDPANGNYDGSGHSDLYGFGKVDAFAAVSAAESGLGLPVTFRVSTINGTTGGRPTDATNPVAVTYTLRNIQRQVAVWDGNDVTVNADAGSTIAYPTLSNGSGTAQRWIITQPTNGTVNAAGDTFNATYFHQLRRQFIGQVQSGAAALAAPNTVNVTYKQFAADQTNAIDGTGINFFVDAGTSATFDATSTQSTAQERWVADDTTGDGVPDPVIRPVTLKDNSVIAGYYHQVRPRVLLSGTNSSSTVSCSKRKLFGKDNLPANLFGTFQEFSDVRSQLAFSAASSGSPILAAEGVREFTVEKGLNVTVQYVVQPRQDLSALAASVAELPADGRTAVTITVTIRDSAGNPVSGIDPSRVQVYPSDTDGVRVTVPTVPTDTTGRLVYNATRDIPGALDFTGTLDGQSIASQVSVEFLQVMHVPLPVTGLYMVSFPITPADSHAAFLNMDVTPKPPQVARLTDGTNTYVYFRANQPNAALNIAPGRGFFINTHTAGSAELTGQWSTGPTFNFQTSPVGFHQLGNPQTDRAMLWRLADFEVFQAGNSQGLLNVPAAQALIDPVAWIFSGQGYEMVADPTMPGTDGLRSQVGVFEGFFWHASQDGVGVVYTPNSGRARAALPISPSNCGFAIAATVAERTSTVVLGTRPTATRAAAAPPSPTGPDAVSLTVVTADGGRAAADWLGQPLSQPVTWRLAAATAQPGQSVTLSWSRLGRQLPGGYQVQLRDLQTGRATLLNTHSSYVFQSGAAGTERQFAVTVLPRAGHGLQVLGFQPAVGRARAMSFGVQLSGEAQVWLQISSLTGRPVAQTSPLTATGNATLAWNGLDSAGRKVPAGVYQVTLFARNAAGESLRVVRVVTLR